MKIIRECYLMKSWKSIYIFIFFQVSEEKMSGFRFWIEGDAWRVSFCFRSLYIVDISWNYIQDILGSIRFSLLLLNLDTSPFHKHNWRIVRNTWRVTLFRMSLLPQQNLAALMQICNCSKRELLAKVWLVSKNKAYKITIST